MVVLFVCLCQSSRPSSHYLDLITVKPPRLESVGEKKCHAFNNLSDRKIVILSEEYIIYDFVYLLHNRICMYNINKLLCINYNFRKKVFYWSTTVFGKNLVCLYNFQLRWEQNNSCMEFLFVLGYYISYCYIFTKNCVYTVYIDLMTT